MYRNEHVALGTSDLAKPGAIVHKHTDITAPAYQDRDAPRTAIRTGGIRRSRSMKRQRSINFEWNRRKDP
jgi:hypothetical protein